MSRLKILYVGPDYLGSNGTCWRNALVRLGHEVKTVDTGRFLPLPKTLAGRVWQKLSHRPPVHQVVELNHAVTHAVGEFQPDLTLYIQAACILPETLDQTRRIGLNFAYMNDDMFNPDNQSFTFFEAIKRMDCILTTKSYNVSEFHAAGALLAVFIPNAYDPEIHYPAKPSCEESARYRGDVAFIGTFRPERADDLAQIAACNGEFTFNVWGGGWDKTDRPLYWHKRLSWQRLKACIRGKELWGSQMGKAIQLNKISLNLLYHANRDLHTSRSFEIPACGGFMLAERTEEHRLYFEEDQEAIYFSSFEEMMDKIRFYLTHEEARRRIAEAGYQRCLKSGYRYEDRARVAIEQVHRLRQQVTPASRRRTQYHLAILASHPIQYQVPLFQALAAHPELDLHIFFCSRWGIKQYQDPGFQVSFAWDRPLLDGYRSTFLRNLSPWPGPSRFFGLMNPGIVSAIWRGRFDALWIHGWDLASNWLAWSSAATRHLPILLRAETNGLTEPQGMKRVFRKIFLKTFFSQVSGFLAIGTRNANFYKSFGVSEKQIFWMPYTVDNEFFMAKAQALTGQKWALREQAGLPPHLPVILFCGKLITRKRPWDLLKAFAHLARGLEASLVFVGDGPLRQPLERLVAQERLKHVYFLGFRNQQELPACYVMADVLVLPSDIEPWGLVLNEAMCFGLPVIASDHVGAAVDLVRERVNGFTYPVGDIETLADRLRQVLRDEPTRQEMECQSRKLIIHWKIPEAVEGVVKALHVVVNRRDVNS